MSCMFFQILLYKECHLSPSLHCHYCHYHRLQCPHPYQSFHGCHYHSHCRHSRCHLFQFGPQHLLLLPHHRCNTTSSSNSCSSSDASSSSSSSSFSNTSFNKDLAMSAVTMSTLSFFYVLLEQLIPCLSRYRSSVETFNFLSCPSRYITSQL